MPIGGRQNNSTPSSGGGLRPYAGRQGHRPVGAVLELDGHKNHLAVAEIFQIVNLELVFAVALVPRLAWLISIFDGCAVMHMLPSAAACHPVFSFFSADLSSIVRAMGIPPKLLTVIYRING